MLIAYHSTTHTANDSKKSYNNGPNRNYDMDEDPSLNQVRLMNCLKTTKASLVLRNYFVCFLAPKSKCYTERPTTE